VNEHREERQMLISTKGRYAIRVMIDIAEQNTMGYVPLKDVADRQNVSEKYLESIISMLVKADLVEGVRGKGGGYRLTRLPDKYTAWEILNASNGTMAPVACLREGAPECSRRDICKALPIYENLYKLMEMYLGGITLQQMMDGEVMSAEDFAGQEM
jgi:Rrf2 family iron-sulfur cluster assembly transcriptional regulator